MSERPPQYATIEKKVRKWTDKWVKRLKLNHFEIETIFVETYDGDDDGGDMKTSAETEARWNYMMARIKYYLPRVAAHNDTVLEQIVVHELCHVLLAPEQSIVDKISGLGTVEAEALAAQQAELLELSNEMTCRALWGAWEESEWVVSW